MKKISMERKALIQEMVYICGRFNRKTRFFIKTCKMYPNDSAWDEALKAFVKNEKNF